MRILAVVLALFLGGEDGLRAGTGVSRGARAVVIEAAGRRVALVDAGAGETPRSLAMHATALLSEDREMGEENVLVSGGGAAAGNVAAALRAAVEDLRPAEVRFGRGDLRGLVASAAGRGAAVDEAVYALEIRSGEERRAVVAIAAARPDPAPEGLLLLAGPPSDQRIGGDGFTRRVEEALSEAGALPAAVSAGDGRIRIGDLDLLRIAGSAGASRTVRIRSVLEAREGGRRFVVGSPDGRRDDFGAGPPPERLPPRGRDGPPEPVRVEPLAPASDRTPFSVERVWFRSEMPSGVPENDTFPVERYVPAGTPRAAILVLPIWRGGVLLAERVVAGHLARRGFECAIVPLPWQFQRAPDGVESGRWTISSDLERTRDAMLQSAADARTVADWLEAGAGRRGLGILGISLGAHVAAAAYQADERFRAGVFVMAGGDPASMIWAASSETRRMKAELVERGVGLDRVREFFRPLDPAAVRDVAEFPGFPRYRGVLMVNGTEDTVIPPANAEILREALGRPEILWLPVNHYSMAFEIPAVLKATDRHLDGIFD